MTSFIEIDVSVCHSVTSRQYTAVNPADYYDAILVTQPDDDNDDVSCIALAFMTELHLQFQGQSYINEDIDLILS